MSEQRGIEIKNLWKYYGGFCAVESLNLEVNPGEIFGLLGANGAGKSTTIKSIVGLTAHDKGQIIICGTDADAHPIKAKSKLGFIPENPAYYGRLTGREFLDLCASLRGKGRENIDGLAEKFRISDKLNEQICRYSKGTAQKIGLIQALMHEPLALVLDEPFTGLDIPSRVSLKELLRERAEAGCAILVSLHEPETAQDLCGRIGIMKKGKLALCGSPSAVIRAAGAANLESAFMKVVG